MITPNVKRVGYLESFVPYEGCSYIPRNIINEMKAEGAKLILSAPKASGTAPLTGVQSPWVDLSAGYDVALTNAVVGGDFADGTTGWSTGACTIAVANKTLSATGIGSASAPEVKQTIGSAVAGKKYLIIAKMRVTNALASSILLWLYDGVGNIATVQNAPVANQWYTLSAVVTLPNTNATLQVKVGQSYADAATANGKVMEVQEVMCIDLTTAFTATREPSIQDIQQAMTKAGTTFWNGTKTLKFTNDAVGSNFSGTQTSGWVTDILACDTGVEHTITNLLGNDGNFGVDSNADGLADGFAQLGTLTSKTMSGNAQNYTVSASSSGIQRAVTMIPTNVYYACSFNALGRIQLKIGASTYVSGDASNGFSSCMGVVELAFTAGALFHLDVRASAWTQISVSKMHILNLTAIFGAGKEPTQAQMDRLVQWMIARFGYINTKVLKLAWRSMQRFDGMDDYDAITNSASMDLGVVAGKEQVWSVLFRVESSNSQNGRILAKNNTDTASIQYGVVYDNSGGQALMYMNGAFRSTIPSVLKNEFYHVVFYRNTVGLITPYINKVSKPTATYANTLITQSNIRIGRQETASSHFKGDLVLLNLYEADTLDIAKILDLEWKIARGYIYTGS